MRAPPSPDDLTLYGPAADEQPATGWSAQGRNWNNRFARVSFQLCITLVGLAHRTASIMPHTVTTEKHHYLTTFTLQVSRAPPLMSAPTQCHVKTTWIRLSAKVVHGSA